MGFTPQDVDRMSVWQFSAALNGFIRANSSKDDKKLSEAERSEISDWILSSGSGPRTLTTKVYWWDGLQFSLFKIVTFQIDG